MEREIKFFFVLSTIKRDTKLNCLSIHIMSTDEFIFLTSIEDEKFCLKKETLNWICDGTLCVVFFCCYCWIKKCIFFYSWENSLRKNIYAKYLYLYQTILYVWRKLLCCILVVYRVLYCSIAQGRFFFKNENSSSLNMTTNREGRVFNLAPLDIYFRYQKFVWTKGSINFLWIHYT